MQKIGMRNIKTALAVFISTGICHILKLEFPFYAGIAAVIVMGLSISETITSSKNRLMATIIGGAIGIPFSLFVQNNFIATGIGIILVIYICNLIGCKRTINVACIVFIYNMINLKGKMPLFYTSERFIATLIGVITAIAINYLIFPLNPVHKIKSLLRDLINITTLHIEEDCIKNKDIDLKIFEKALNNLKSQIDIFHEEIKIKKYTGLEAFNIDNIYELFNNTLYHLKIINELGDKTLFSEENVDKLNSLFKIDGLKSENIELNKMNTIFNYHLEKILENYINLKIQLQITNNCIFSTNIDKSLDICN